MREEVRCIFGVVVTERLQRALVVFRFLAEAKALAWALHGRTYSVGRDAALQVYNAPCAWSRRADRASAGGSSRQPSAVSYQLSADRCLGLFVGNCVIRPSSALRPESEGAHTLTSAILACENPRGLKPAARLGNPQSPVAAGLAALDLPYR